MGARVAAKLNERLLLLRRLPQLLELFDRSRCKSRIVIVDENEGADFPAHRTLPAFRGECRRSDSQLGHEGILPE